MPPNVWGQREAMAEIHYNLLILENSSVQGSRGSTWNIYISIQNHIWGFHVQYNGTLAPLQYYLITLYDTTTRPHILQRWIEATI